MPRGANLKKGSPQRARDDKLIRDRWLAKQKLAPPPELEDEPNPTENPDMPSESDRLRATGAFREIRRRHWERPVLDADGRLCARPLDEAHVLPWESLDEVAKEVPDYLGLGWWVEETSIGTLLHGPHRLPELLDPDDRLPYSTDPAQEAPAATGKPVEAVPVEVEVVDGVALVGASDPGEAES